MNNLAFTPLSSQTITTKNNNINTTGSNNNRHSITENNNPINNNQNNLTGTTTTINNYGNNNTPTSEKISTPISINKNNHESLTGNGLTNTSTPTTSNKVESPYYFDDNFKSYDEMSNNYTDDFENYSDDHDSDQDIFGSGSSKNHHHGKRRSKFKSFLSSNNQK